MIRFSPSFLDEIRARVRVSDVVGRKVKLQRRGREFVGLSPFNAEKSPSFTVNDQKGFYHCFSSGKHGDIFRFLTDVEGLSFPEAVERLAQDAGLDMPRADPRAVEREEQRQTLHDVLERACAFFEGVLQAREGARARGYLADRGVEPAMQRRFRLGYAGGERHALKQFLAGEGVSAQDMVRAGLVIAGDDIPVSFDRFRDRVMFPITDPRGRIIGFGGRALSPDAQAKYLNSPETELFHKGATLYNAASARKAAHDTGAVIAVEGYMDVIALAQAGIDHVVAPLGTALSEDQLGLLWRMADEPVLCFDGDGAGLKAAYRAIDVALPHLAPGKSLRFALLPDGRDPDDLVRAQGRAGMDQVLERALPLVDMIWQREHEGRDLATPERRAAFEARMGEIMSVIGNEAVRRHYFDDLRTRLAGLWAPRHSGAGARGRQGGASQWRRDTPGWGRPGPGRSGPGRSGPYAGGAASGRVSMGASHSLRASAMLNTAQTGAPPREAVLLVAAINHPEILDEFAEELGALELTSGDAERLRAAALDGFANGGEAALRGLIEAGGLGPALERLEALVRAGRVRFALPDAQPLEAIAGFRHTLALHRKSLTLHKELMEAERILAHDASEESLAHLKDIQAQLQSVEGTEALLDGLDT